MLLLPSTASHHGATRGNRIHSGLRADAEEAWRTSVVPAPDGTHDAYLAPERTGRSGKPGLVERLKQVGVACRPLALREQSKGA
jgi:hypothetical protein